jgi:hypothetical protein
MATSLLLGASEQNGKHTGGLVVSRPRGLDFMERVKELRNNAENWKK